jgi:hypothetical protein
LVQWRRRKKGSPRQIGKPFPLDESMQKKKGLLDTLRGRFAGKHTSPYDNQRVDALKELIRDHLKSDEERLAGDILTESDARYLERKGLISVDPYTDAITLTEKGQVAFLGEKMKQRSKALKSLTELEKDMIEEKRASYYEEGDS